MITFKEIEKNAKQGKFIQLFAETDSNIKEIITYILLTKEDQEIVKNIRILINQFASPFIETIYNGLLFQLDDADIKIIIDSRCKDIENMLKEFGNLHIESKNIKIDHTGACVNFAIIVDDNDFLVQSLTNDNGIKIQANLNCNKKYKCFHEYIYKYIRQFDKLFNKLPSLENTNKNWFELNHKDIQISFDREIIHKIESIKQDDVIQKYKEYISKLENKVDELTKENNKLKNKITLD